MAKNVSSLSEDSKTYAVLGVVLTVIGFIIVKLTKPNDEYAMFYAKQGLVIGLGFILISFLSMMFFFIPFGFMLVWIVQALLFVAFVVAIINSLSGEKKDLPVVSSLASKF